MVDKKFDPRKLQKLNNPDRLKDIPPEFISTRLQNTKPEILIEIGAGTGFFSIALRDVLSPATLYACDISPAMIDWMTENVVPDYPDIVVVKTEELSVPLEDRISDLVFMINLHHELDDPVGTIAEAHRLLKPGGNILIIDWKKEEMSEGPPQQIRCTPEQVADQLTHTGFNKIDISTELPKHFFILGSKAP